MMPLIDARKRLDELEALKGTADKATLIEAKKNLAWDALVQLFEIAVAPLRFYEQDAESAGRILKSDLINDEVAAEVYNRLVRDGDVDAYEEYVASKCEDAQRFYAKYFFRHVIEKDGLPYSTILEMWWNDEAKIWERQKDGVFEATCFMPYQGTPLKVVRF
jgi:hypothetical protein